MPEACVTIAAAVGLHARPAATFVQIAGRHPCAVHVSKSGQDPIDGKSMLAVLGLSAEQGDEILIRTDGDAADLALEELVALVTEREQPSETTA